MNKKNVLILVIALFCSVKTYTEEFKVINKSGHEASASISTCKEINGDKTCTYSAAKKIPNGKTVVFNVTKPNDGNTYSFWLAVQRGNNKSPLNESITIPGSFEIRP